MFRYVEILIQQQEWLVAGLIKLYRRTQICSDQPGLVHVVGDKGEILVHHILKQLGVLKKDDSHDFVESKQQGPEALDEARRVSQSEGAGNQGPTIYGSLRSRLPGYGSTMADLQWSTTMTDDGPKSTASWRFKHA